MAYVEKRVNADGKARWVGRYRVDGKLKSTKTFHRKTDATTEATKLEQAAKRSEWVDPSASEITLSEYFDARQRGRSGRAPRTLEAERERFTSLIEPKFGHVPLKRLSHDDINDWSSNMVARRSGKVASQARRRDATRLLVAILDDAVNARRLASNPARTRTGKVGNMPPASKSKAHRYLTHEELRRLADATSTEQARTLILLAGLTGLRWGELSALQVGDVDLLRRRVKVQRACTRLDSGHVVLGDTKTHANREVPLYAALRPLIERQMVGKPRTALLFESPHGPSEGNQLGALRRELFDRDAFKPAARTAGHAVSALQRLLGFADDAVSGLYDDATHHAVQSAQRRLGLAVTGVCDPLTWEALAADSKAAHDAAMRERRAAARAAGIKMDGSTRSASISRARQVQALSRLTLGPGAADFDPLTLHDLRHTAASLAIGGGATVKAVQRLLGHQSAVLTLNTYAGLFDSDLDALGDSLSEAFEAGSASRAHYALTGGAVAPAGVTVMGEARSA